MTKPSKQPWSKEEVELLINGYQEGVDTKAIAEHLGRSWRSVRGKAHTLGLSHAGRDSQLYSQADDAFLKNSAQSLTCSEIAQVLGRSEGSVSQRGRRLGVTFQHESKNALYAKDHYFFSKPTLENSRIAGLIAADGWIRPKSSGKTINQVGISLTECDVHLLEHLRNVTGYTGVIRYYDAKIEDQIHPQAELRISGVPQWISDLEHNWRLTPNKTLTLQPPNEDSLTPEQLLAYHVGLIEGDGYIRFNNGTLTVSMVTASPAFADWLCDSWQRIVGAKPSRELHQNKTAHYVIFHGKNARSLCSQLMATNTHKLMRKWDIAISEIARFQ